LYFLLKDDYKSSVPIDTDTNDYFYFSVKTNSHTNITLLSGNKVMTSWKVDSSGYKSLEFYGSLKDASSISLIIEHLSPHDTISILGVNLYRDNRLFSLNKSFLEKTLVANALVNVKKDEIQLTAIQANQSACITFFPYYSWETNDLGLYKKIVIIGIFVLCFLLIFIFAPKSKYFFFTVFISSMIMVVVYVLNHNDIWQVKISSQNEIKNPEVFHNHTPLFSGEKKYYKYGNILNYTTPINLHEEKYLRFDIESDNRVIDDLKISFINTFICKTFSLSKIPQKCILLNDIVLQGDKYIITGTDPYFKITTSYFLSRIEWLLFLKDKLCLFVSLIFFMLLICLSRYMNFIEKSKFHISQLTLFFIPAAYVLVCQPWKSPVADNKSEYIYFSARTSSPGFISINNSNECLAKWEISQPGFKLFQYKKAINTDNRLFLLIENLSANDTIFLNSVNYCKGETVQNLLAKDTNLFNISNAQLLSSPLDYNVVVSKSETPVRINLKPFNILQTENQNKHAFVIVLMIIFILILFAAILNLNPKKNVLISVLTSIFVFIFYWIGKDDEFNVKLSSKNNIEASFLYYYNTPEFWSEWKLLSGKHKGVFISQVLLQKYKFQRVDLEGNVKTIEEPKIALSSGLIKKTWNYSRIPYDYLVVNDMVKKGNTYHITGPDPYFILNSAAQSDDAEYLLILKKHIFIFLSMVLFLVLLVICKVLPIVNYRHAIINIFFIVFISNVIGFSIFSTKKNYIVKEKRNAQSFPDFSIDSCQSFTNKINNFIVDNVPGRTNIITLNNLIEYKTFNELINNKKIHFGKDGWMFFIQGWILETYENRKPLTEAELKKMSDILVERNNWLQKKGIKFYLVFPPSALLIYEDKLRPSIYKHNGVTKLEQFLSYLKKNTRLNIIDVYQTLYDLRQASPKDIYYKDDPHWNFYGAYYAYKTIVEAIKKDFPGIPSPANYNDFEWFKFGDAVPDSFLISEDYKEFMNRNFGGEGVANGMYKIMLINEYYQNEVLYPLSKKLSMPTEIQYLNYPISISNNPAISYVNNKISTPSVLMFRDSFSNWLSHYLSHNFQRISYFWTPEFCHEVVIIEKPDIVIQEMSIDIINHLLLSKPKPIHRNDTVSK
jgi:hypothetical protein